MATPMGFGFDGGASAQKPFFDTGSITGYHRVLGLGRSGYLSATGHLKEPLCGNEEGWGPLSPIRYDFTPCFIDVWIASVAAFGLLFGPIAVWWLVAWRRPTDVAKDWHFWTKQVGHPDFS
jgi:ATP-binding cassette, subfamily C (CFTR/MRP), member 1